MDRPLISVIVPCYNAEQYIDRCVDTIVNQTIGLDNLEIILVNDASTDNTLQRLKEWEQRYQDNILVITYEENLRQGGARNIGIQYANADYIGFVDADDWIELDMYERLYEPIKDKGFDIVQGKYVRESYPGQYTIGKTGAARYTYEFKKIGSFYQYNVDESNVGKEGRYGGIIFAIYSKKLIINNDVWFPERTAYEDNYWGAILKLYARNLCIVDRVVYHYYENMQSTSKKDNSPQHFDRLKIEIDIIEEYKKRGAFLLFKNELERDFLQRFYLNTLHIIFTRFDHIPDIFGYLKKTIYEYFPDYKANQYYSQFDEVDRELLRLLDMDGPPLTADELNIIKRGYLQVFGVDV